MDTRQLAQVGYDLSCGEVAHVFTFPTTIPDKAIDLAPHPPEFAKSFSDTVGNAGTPADGFDVLLIPADLHLSDARNFLAGLDIGLADLGVSQAELGTDFHADFATHLTATIQQGQADFDSYAVHLTGHNPPPTPTPGPPTTGGGGLQPVDFGTLVLGGPTKTLSVRFVNPFNFVVHPTGITINQGKLQVFVATSECGASIPANGACMIVVTFRPLLPGHYAGLLVFNTDDPNSPYTLGLSGTVAPRPIGGGGGRGGGGGCDPFIDPSCGGFGDSPPF